jgi:hypothetical protein
MHQRKLFKKNFSLRTPGHCRRHRRVQAGLEAAGGNSVCPVTYLELERLTASAQHAVRSVVEQLLDSKLALLQVDGQPIVHQHPEDGPQVVHVVIQVPAGPMAK